MNTVSHTSSVGPIIALFWGDEANLKSESATSKTGPLFVQDAGTAGVDVGAMYSNVVIPHAKTVHLDSKSNYRKHTTFSLTPLYVTNVAASPSNDLPRWEVCSRDIGAMTEPSEASQFNAKVFPDEHQGRHSLFGFNGIEDAFWGQNFGRRDRLRKTSSALRAIYFDTFGGSSRAEGLVLLHPISADVPTQTASRLLPSQEVGAQEPEATSVDDNLGGGVERFRIELVRNLSRYRSEDAGADRFAKIASDVDVVLRIALDSKPLPDVEVDDEGSVAVFWRARLGVETSRLSLSFTGSGFVNLTIVYSTGRSGEAVRVSVKDLRALKRLLSSDEAIRIMRG